MNIADMDNKKLLEDVGVWHKKQKKFWSEESFYIRDGKLHQVISIKEGFVDGIEVGEFFELRPLSKS